MNYLSLIGELAPAEDELAPAEDENKSRELRRQRQTKPLSARERALVP